MRKHLRLRYLIILAVAGLALWMAFYPGNWQNWLGFSRYDYFTAGQNYALYSGFLPVFVATLGLSTIAVGLWHHLNCHTAGCPRIVRHKIANGEYGVCGRHWREINGHPEKHRLTVGHLRDHHHAHLRATGREP